MGLQVVDLVGDGDAFGLGSEVVVVDPNRLTAPSSPWVFEASHQFQLLGFDTNNGVSSTGKAIA